MAYVEAAALFLMWPTESIIRSNNMFSLKGEKLNKRFALVGILV